MPADVLDLNRLKAVVVRLLDEAIADNGSPAFKLEDDLYWCIDFTGRFDLSREPAINGTGSLVDDWEMTHSLADEPTKVGSYALTEIAPLLDYVGSKLVERLGKTGG